MGIDFKQHDRIDSWNQYVASDDGRYGWYGSVNYLCYCLDTGSKDGYC